MRGFRRFSLVFGTIILVCFLTFLFGSCEIGFKKHSIVFIVDGHVYDREKAFVAKEMELPEEPVKEGYIFRGWYRDKDVWEKEITSHFTVNNMLLQDIEVYAYFTHDHREDDWFVLSSVSATESEAGEIVYECSVCGEKRTEVLPILPHEHMYGNWQTSETHHFKQCAADGERTGYGEHVFGEGVTVREATKEKEGEIEYVCSVCGYRKSVSYSLTTSYTATFVADGETVDTVSFTLQEGTLTEPSVPNKPGYTGAWETYELTATDIIVNAVYEAIEYTATFVADGEQVGEAITFTVETTSIEAPEVPAKAGYTGAWEAYTLGTENITVNAIYTIVEYTATFVADGEQVGEAITFTVETTSIEAPEAPAKAGYTGAWEAYTLGTENITVNAIYTIVEYTATFVADGEQVGEAITFTVLTESIEAPEVPAKTGYTGAWEAYTLGTENITVNAIYTINTYTITFVVDGVETSAQYDYGTTPAYEGSTDKERTAQYTYTFAGWTPAIAEVTGNATYTAQYDATINKYTVKFVVDGVETSAQFDYGTTPVYDGTPAKAADAQFSYTFTGWDPAITTVEADVTYTAKFEGNVNKYTVKFVVDGVETSADYDYGTAASEIVVPNTAKAADAQYSYTFIGWDPAVIADVTGNATYTAQYSTTLVEYSATFVADGETVEVRTFTAETVVIEEPAVPQKDGYTGVWEEYELGSADIVIHAVYTEEERESFVLSGTVLTGVTDTTITTAEVPSGVTEIGANAFAGCSSMTSVTLPTSVRNVGNNAFFGCSALSAVYYAGSVADWCGITFGTNANPLLSAHALCPNGGQTAVTKLTVPGSVTTIKPRAFEGCSCTEIVLSSGVETVGTGALNGCSALRKITIAETVTALPANLFAGCTSLERIEYGGTTEEWYDLSKGDNWLGDAEVEAVYCYDGEAEVI